MGVAQKQRNSYNGVPTRARQDVIRMKVEDALSSSLEIYGIKQMARDVGFSDEEAEWAEEHICFYAKIER